MRSRNKSEESQVLTTERKPEQFAFDDKRNQQSYLPVYRQAGY